MPYRRRSGYSQSTIFGARAYPDMTFDSWGAYVSRAELPESGSLGRSSHDLADASWFGTRDFDEAVKLARDGWADGALRLSELTARLEGKIGNVAAVRQIAYAMAGPGVLDMGRYLMGHPEPYMVWRESQELTDINPERIVKIVIACGANAALSTQRIWWRGAAACAITDLIESTGARVELEIARKNRSYSDATHTRRILVKRAQDHVAPEILAFALAHNASHRRIDFAVRETLPVTIRKAIGAHSEGNYGVSVDLTQDEIAGALYIPYDALEFGAPESTAQWIIKTLGDYGIEVVHE